MTFRILKLILMLSAAVFWTRCANPPAGKTPESTMKKTTFDWQGHRGARGLAPENSIPAFLLALEFPEITTLELDLAVSKDSVLVLSHEPWMSHAICLQPDGAAIEEAEEKKFALHQMTYETIKSFDCGSKGNSRFPEQKAMVVYKPALGEVVEAVEARCKALNRQPVRYNIEIKSSPELDGQFTPAPPEFARLVLEEVKRLNIHDRTCIQSFDIRALQAVRQLDPDITVAFLIENAKGLEENLADLGFIPQVYSPYYLVLSPNLVNLIHEKMMLVIPWTVNDSTTMQGLINMGVDGIITDYPDRIPR